MELGEHFSVAWKRFMTLKARPGCEQQSMLVKIIQPGEVDKDFPRSTKVWFEGVNRIHSILTRPFIRRMRMLYMERRRALISAIHIHMGGMLEVIGAEAGMHLVALLPRATDDVAASKKAAQKGISAIPLSTCYLEPPTRGGLILGYGGANAHQIHEGIRRLRMSVFGQTA